MHRPSFILRLLLLVALSGWLGIVQPASAQQTVTLSGRVTDAAGNAVSGATVNLEDPGWVGQETDANGNYRLSVSPGTYRLLRVRPQHGPLIAQKIEGLRLSTNTTRNFVLETGVTLSGQVTSNGQPVPHAWLWVVNDEGQEVSFNAANASGHYSLGVPTGTYKVNVYSEDFLDTTVEGVAVTQDTVLNITLESGVPLEGKVVDDAGQPVPDAQVCAHESTEAEWWRFCSQTEPGGNFQLSIPPDAVYIVRISLVAPQRLTRHRLEVHGVGVSDLVLTVSRAPTPFVPDGPPKAALISISPPTADGEVTLTGAAGAVAPHSAVVAFTLETGHFTTAQATGSGSFTVALFAPAGSSVFIKADPVGLSMARFLFDEGDSIFLSNGEQIGNVDALPALPGTILRIAGPPGADTLISSTGRTYWDEHGLPAWTFHGSLNTQTLAPGDPLRARGTVQVSSSVLQRIDALQVDTTLRLERLSDTDGSSILRRNTFASTLVTPTGLPIERLPLNWDEGLDVYRQVPLVKTAATRAEAEVDLTLTLPSDLPAGYYRPFLQFYFPEMPSENPPSRSVVRFVHFAGRGSFDEAPLPIIRVGNPAPPHLYWPLLLDTLSNGSRGVLAMEDADRFGVAQRILTPSETFVIPRLSAVSDQPLTYRLEPFVPTVGLSNTNIPSPPRIPFQFPSGSLTVRIRQPDGTERVLGPAPFVQSRSKSLVTEDGFTLDRGGGHISDAYQLSTMDPRFKVAFTQDGLHVITVEGTIDDIWGNTWTGGGTYEVHVGRVLTLDTAVLPGTHFEVGDGFNPGLVVSPPITAEVEVRIQHMPHSDVSQLQERVIRGRTNRFGYFQPAGNSVIFEQPGEYRVDITARGEDAQGQLWMGSRTWGGVVAPVNPTIVAHGRRGIDAQDTIGPQWFFFDQITQNGSTAPHVPFPFQSGDVQWLEEADAGSAIPLVSFHDPSRQLTRLMRQRVDERWQVPLQLSPGSFAERVVVGEAPCSPVGPMGLIPISTPARWTCGPTAIARPSVPSCASAKRLVKTRWSQRIGALMSATPTRLGSADMVTCLASSSFSMGRRYYTARPLTNPTTPSTARCLSWCPMMIPWASAPSRRFRVTVVGRAVAPCSLSKAKTLISLST